MNNYGTIEELKEIIVNLNVSVLHLTNQLEAKEEELEQYHQVLEAKPAVLVGTKYNYFIERALGATLPLDGGLALTVDEVMKVENEFKDCVNWIEQLEQSLKQSASEIENEKAVSANYKALWEEAAHENEILKREMECRDKKIQDLEEAMTVAEKDVVGDETSETRPLTMFKSLPHLNGNKEIVEDWGYTPSLYHFEGKWVVSWVHCEEGDTLLDYEGNTAEQAIENAYKNFRNEVPLQNCSNTHL